MHNIGFVATVIIVFVVATSMQVNNEKEYNECEKIESFPISFMELSEKLIVLTMNDSLKGFIESKTLMKEDNKLCKSILQSKMMEYEVSYCDRLMLLRKNYVE